MGEGRAARGLVARMAQEGREDSRVKPHGLSRFRIVDIKQFPVTCLSMGMAVYSEPGVAREGQETDL